jgi:hypothetical protein
MSIHTDAVASAHSRMRAQLDQTLDAGLRGLQHLRHNHEWVWGDDYFAEALAVLDGNVDPLRV